MAPCESCHKPARTYGQWGVQARQWIIVTPLALGVPSVIHALESVGKTTTRCGGLFNCITTYITLEMFV